MKHEKEKTQKKYTCMMMMFSFRFLIVLLFQFYTLLLLPLFSKPVSSIFPHKIPRLNLHNYKQGLSSRNPSKIASSSTSSNDDLKTYFYTQTLDHFNYGPQSYATFEQRYMVNSRNWGGANSKSPILAHFGPEDSLDNELEYVGFVSEHSHFFKALEVYIEHRYYGKSVPFGSMDEAMKNETIRGYFNSAQAIADYAEVLLHVKEQFSAQDSPIIVIGGSYGGMLASWFRLKYPHIALGALASSAPILYFDNITPQNGYYSIVTTNFKEVSDSCYQTIRKSWSEIDKVASNPAGLSILSQKFKTCSHLKNSSELKEYLDSIYSFAAQYNLRPVDSVKMVCNAVDGAPNGTDVLGRIFNGVVSYEGNQTCYDMNEYNSLDESIEGWPWQTCSELVIPIGRGENDTMFPAQPFNLDQYIKHCKDLFGVAPRPHWVTTYYGGNDIKLVLQRFGSNIIFSNGLKDPYSSGGVLEDISESVVAVTTANGSHCLDILYAKETDPEWLIMQRNTEVKIIQGWINKFYVDLSMTSRNKSN